MGIGIQMANFRRNKPRKSPRSVMSSPDRVFETARNNTITEEERTKPAKKKRKKRKTHGIEWNLFDEWHLWKWYDSEEQRDQALDALIKSQCSIYKNRRRHRKIDR